MNRNLIQPTADTDKGLVVKSHSATQSAGLQEWQAADGTIMGFFRSENALSGEGNYGGGLCIGPQPAAIVTQNWFKGTTSDATLVVEGSPTGAALIVRADPAAGPGTIFQFRDQNNNPTFALGKSGTTEPSNFAVFDNNDEVLALYPNSGGGQVADLLLCYEGVHFNPLAGIEGRGSFYVAGSTSDNAGHRQGRITGSWADNTAATYKGRVTLTVDDVNGTREGLRIEGDGTNPRLGFLGASAVVRQTATAAATDLASVIALANSLRTGLRNNGLFS